MIRIILAAMVIARASPAFSVDLTSPDVKDGAQFDTKYVSAKFGGQSISPALAWTNVPANAKSLAVTMFDPTREPRASGTGSPSTFPRPPPASTRRPAPPTVRSPPAASRSPTAQNTPTTTVPARRWASRTTTRSPSKLSPTHPL